MAKTKEQKAKIVEKLKQNLQEQKGVVFINYAGMRVKELFALRNKIKQQNDRIQAAKKNLIKLAFSQEKLPLQEEILNGEIALVFSLEDEIKTAKAIYQSGKDNQKPEILGAFFENEFLEARKVIELAKLPSKQELYGRLVSDLNNPISKLVYTFQANIKGLLRVLALAKT